MDLSTPKDNSFIFRFNLDKVGVNVTAGWGYDAYWNSDPHVIPIDELPIKADAMQGKKGAFFYHFEIDDRNLAFAVSGLTAYPLYFLLPKKIQVLME